MDVNSSCLDDRPTLSGILRFLSNEEISPSDLLPLRLIAMREQALIFPIATARKKPALSLGYG